MTDPVMIAPEPTRAFSAWELNEIGCWLASAPSQPEPPEPVRQMIDRRFGKWAGHAMVALSPALFAASRMEIGREFLQSLKASCEQRRAKVRPCDLAAPLDLLADPYSCKPYLVVYATRLASNRSVA